MASLSLKTRLLSESWSNRNRELKFEQQKEEEISKVNAEHMRQKQVLLTEFKQAQEILKAKIYETEQS